MKFISKVLLFVFLWIGKKFFNCIDVSIDENENVVQMTFSNEKDEINDNL